MLDVGFGTRLRGLMLDRKGYFFGPYIIEVSLMDSRRSAKTLTLQQDFAGLTGRET